VNFGFIGAALLDRIRHQRAIARNIGNVDRRVWIAA